MRVTAKTVYPKTPRAWLLGVFLCLPFAAQVAAECGRASGVAVQVARVVDGDTLKLRDGRSVRVLGINAPEMQRPGQPGQALAVEARGAAAAFVDAAKGRVFLGFEQQQRDHYDRLLAHVYDAQGQSLAVSLLRQGLVFPIAVPPNVAQADCLFAIQQQARQKGLGVWASRAWQPRPATGLTQADTGFQRIRGRVAKVTVNSSVWLELEGQLVVRIAKADWRYFPRRPADWQALLGQTLEVHGWVTPQRNRNKGFKPLVLAVHSPHALQVSAANKP